MDDTKAGKSISLFLNLYRTIVSKVEGRIATYSSNGWFNNDGWWVRGTR
jgi:hypothetical protein